MKKGSISVMLAMIFVSLMMIVIVLVNGSTKITMKSYCDGALQLAGKSILSEYHIALKEHYGIMAFKSYETEVNKKLDFYSKASFSKRKGSIFDKNHSVFTIINPQVKHLSCDLRAFSLANTEIFEEDILNYMKYPNLTEKQRSGEVYEGNRILINNRIIKSLPSQGMEAKGLYISFAIAEGFNSWQEILSGKKDIVIIDQYLANNFNCKTERNSSLKTFFANELEYILYGKLSDSSNEKAFLGEFRLLRFGLNSLHIWTDGKKRAEIDAIAAITTSGAAPVTAIILKELWAWAETENDVKRLLAGKNVALYKNSNEWALSLDSVLNGKNGKGYVNPRSEKGLSYKDYIRVFLYLKDKDIKLLRTMDLIQINLQGQYDEEFYIKDCHTGLRYNGTISGQEYSYVQKY